MLSRSELDPAENWFELRDLLIELLIQSGQQLGLLRAGLTVMATDLLALDAAEATRVLAHAANAITAQPAQAGAPIIAELFMWKS